MGKLLVTGGMGHVGLEIVKQSVEAGIEVVAQYMTTFREADATRLGDTVTWVKCDLANPYEVAMLAAEHDIEGCIHTAAIANDLLGATIPLRTFESNTLGTTLLLETARRQSWRRFLHVSTGSVHQDMSDAITPVSESREPTPRSLYACTKRGAEMMVDVYASAYGLSAANIRISWIFGPPVVPKAFDAPRGPIPDYLRRALRGEIINDASGGDFAASFTFVPDCAAGLLVAYKAAALNHSTYHLGSGKNVSLFEVTDALRKAMPEADVSIGAGGLPWSDFVALRGPLACDRMKEEFNFEPAHSIDSAVAKFVEWMRANPESYT